MKAVRDALENDVSNDDSDCIVDDLNITLQDKSTLREAYADLVSDSIVHPKCSSHS